MNELLEIVQSWRQNGDNYYWSVYEITEITLIQEAVTHLTAKLISLLLLKFAAIVLSLCFAC